MFKNCHSSEKSQHKIPQLSVLDEESAALPYTNCLAAAAFPLPNDSELK